MSENTPQDPLGQAKEVASNAALELFKKLWSIGGEVLAGRMAQWLWATVPTVALVGFVNVEALGGIVKVIAKMTLGAWLGYWIDRASFRSARPHEPLEAAVRARQEGDDARAQVLLELTARYQWRRAWIIAACVLAAALGV